MNNAADDLISSLEKLADSCKKDADKDVPEDKNDKAASDKEETVYESDQFKEV